MKGRLIQWLVTLTGATLRYRVEDPHGLLRRPPTGPVVFVFWHNRIFLMPHLFRKYWHPLGHNRVAVLISRSKDGEQLADVLRHFNLACVRGSSSRGGAEALRELTRLVQEGYDIGITPDGPRGPRYVLQPGCVSLAHITGIPILPVSYTVNWKIITKSWDRFIIPLPFGRCIVRIGQAVTVPAAADAAGLDTIRVQLQETLTGLSGDATPI